MLGLLAIDLGASSGRVMLAKYSNNSIKLEEIHRFKTLSSTINNIEYWDILYILEEIKKGIKKAKKIKDIKIESLAIDTWGVDIAWLDENNNLISNPICYRDERTLSIVDEVHKKLSKKEIFEETGNQYFSFNTIYQVYYDIYVNKILEKGGKKFLFLSNLLGYFLTGNISYEYTIASTSAMLNKDSKTWSYKIFDTLNFPKNIVGKIEKPGTYLGEYDGIKVMLTAGHDSASGVASTNLNGLEDVYIINGTWSIIGKELDKPLISDKAYNLNIVNEGSVDNKIRTLKMIPGLFLIQKIREKLNIDFSEISNLVNYSNISDDIYIDLENPRFLHSKDIFEELSKACSEKGYEIEKNPSNYIKLAYNSIVKQYIKSIGELEEICNIKTKKVILLGGGIQDKYLVNILKEKLDMKVELGQIEASSLGNIIMQLIGLGYIKNISEGRKIKYE